VRLLVPLSGLAVSLVLLYIPVLEDLVRLWWADQNYSHGFLIPLIDGYLIWGQKDTLTKVTVKPSGWGGLVLALGLFLLLVGRAVELAGGDRGALCIQGLSLILVCIGVVLLLLGKDVLLVLVFPITYLVFMIPLPGGVFTMVTLPLQSYAASVTTSTLQLVNIPALREGNLIYLPSVTLGVTEACSGIRSLLTLLAGAVALSYFACGRWWQHLLLVSSVVPIAILTNALRVTGTGLLAHFLGKEAAQGFFHGFSGLALLVMASFLLCTEMLLLATMQGEVGEREVL
jgi:exosortase